MRQKETGERNRGQEPKMSSAVGYRMIEQIKRKESKGTERKNTQDQNQRKSCQEDVQKRCWNENNLRFCINRWYMKEIFWIYSDLM